MSAVLRMTNGDRGVYDIARALNAQRWQSQLLSLPAIANGTTNGTLKTTTTTTYKIGGKVYSKAATDDLWDLTGITDTASGEYVAVALFLDASGTATYGASNVKATSAAALLDLERVLGLAAHAAKAVIGVFVADPSTDFDAALTGQTGVALHLGLPDGCFAKTAPFTLTAP